MLNCVQVLKCHRVHDGTAGGSFVNQNTLEPPCCCGCTHHVQCVFPAGFQYPLPVCRKDGDVALELHPVQVMFCQGLQLLCVVNPRQLKRRVVYAQPNALQKSFNLASIAG